MKAFVRTLAALCLAVTTLAARAGDVQVSVSGTFELAELGLGPVPVSMQLTLPQDVPDVVPESMAFHVTGIPVLASLGGPAASFADTQLAWFNMADFNYYGADLRIKGAFAPGDMLQLIVSTPTPPYSGSDAAPHLELADLDALYATLTYYSPMPNRVITTASTFDAVYRVTAVPEPATAALLPLGLAWVAWRQRRRAAAA